MAAMSKRKTAVGETKLLMSDADALAMVMEMMAIPGRPGEEAAIMDFIRKKLAAAGAPASAIAMDDAHKRTPLGGQVGNMILKLPGTREGTAADAFCSRRHGAHLRRFAPGAKGQARGQCG